MATIPGYPHKFERPQIGDVFQREQQDGRWEYGQIAGIRGTTSQWIAHLSNGWVDFRDVVRSDTSYSTTEDWHPCKTEAPVESSAEALIAKLASLEERIASLEKLEKATVRPSRSAAG
jgi:hypothetical protein